MEYLPKWLCPWICWIEFLKFNKRKKVNCYERQMLNIASFSFSAVNREWTFYLPYIYIYIKTFRPWIFKQLEKHQLLYNNQLSLNCKVLSSTISYQILAECDNEYVKLCLLVFSPPWNHFQTMRQSEHWIHKKHVIFTKVKIRPWLTHRINSWNVPLVLNIKDVHPS